MVVLTRLLMAHIHLFEYAFFPLTRRSVSEDGLVRHSFLAKGDPLCVLWSFAFGDEDNGY